MQQKGVYFLCFFMISGNIYPQTVKNEFRFTADIVHPIAKHLSAFGSLGVVINGDKNVNEYTVGFPGITYVAAKWLQLLAGLKDIYSNNWNIENTNELRPFVGVKFLIPNTAKVHLSNYTRYEYRHIKKTESKSVQEYSRIRNRFGMVMPLHKNAWTPKTLYALADFEPFYRLDKNMVDVVRIRMGPGYIINEHFRLECIWRVQLIRSAKEDPLAYTDNIFRINLKIATKEGLFKELIHPDF